MLIGLCYIPTPSSYGQRLARALEFVKVSLPCALLGAFSCLGCPSLLMPTLANPPNKASDFLNLFPKLTKNVNHVTKTCQFVVLIARYISC